jgi:hypothetical protein
MRQFDVVQAGALLLVENYVLLDYLPQFPKYRLSIIAMYAT